MWKRKQRGAGVSVKAQRAAFKLNLTDRYTVNDDRGAFNKAHNEGLGNMVKKKYNVSNSSIDGGNLRCSFWK